MYMYVCTLYMYNTTCTCTCTAGSVALTEDAVGMRGVGPLSSADKVSHASPGGRAAVSSRRQTAGEGTRTGLLQHCSYGNLGPVQREVGSGRHNRCDRSLTAICNTVQQYRGLIQRVNTEGLIHSLAHRMRTTVELHNTQTGNTVSTGLLQCTCTCIMFYESYYTCIYIVRIARVLVSPNLSAGSCPMVRVTPRFSAPCTTTSLRATSSAGLREPLSDAPPTDTYRQATDSCPVVGL